MGCLYKVTNTRNGRCYVGITLKTAKERWSEHVYNALERRSKFLLHRAIRKHGPDAFTVRVLKRSDDWDELCRWEVETIARLKTHARHGGYNCTAGGDGTVDLPEESLVRATAHSSGTMKHLNADPEFRAKSIAAVKRLWQDEEFRAKNDARLQRLWQDEEFRAKSIAAASKTMKRLHADPEFRAKNIAAVKRLWADNAYRAKMSEVSRKVAKRLNADPEFAARRNAAASKTAKRLNADPEFRAKQLKAMKRLWQDEEFKARVSEVIRMTNKRLLAEGWVPGRGGKTAFTEFCRTHDLKPKYVRRRLRKRGIHGLKDINDPRVRAVLEEMIAQRRMTQPAKKPRRSETTGLTLH